jgi:hypothetical protein
MGKTKSPYKEEFPKGSAVQIADRGFLEDFLKTWKFHHELEVQQFVYENKIAKVKSVGFYHGGDELYQLSVPGIWHEQCLGVKLSAKTGDNESSTSRKRAAVCWLLLPIFILIPIPFGPWWPTITSVVLCVVLAVLLSDETGGHPEFANWNGGGACYGFKIPRREVERRHGPLSMIKTKTKGR